MSNLPAPLPGLRRVVTGHDTSGNAIVTHDTLLAGNELKGISGGRSGGMWVTTESPTKDNNLPREEDGRLRRIDNPKNLDLVALSGGSNLRYTDLGPGAVAPMHRTDSIDYNILITGELILTLDNGDETHLKNAGDTVIQRGTIHAWKNPSPDQWARWVTVILPAEPAVVDGKPLTPGFAKL